MLRGSELLEVAESGFQVGQQAPAGDCFRAPLRVFWGRRGGTLGACWQARGTCREAAVCSCRRGSMLLEMGPIWLSIALLAFARPAPARQVKRKVPLAAPGEVARALDQRSVYARPFPMDATIDQVGRGARTCAGRFGLCVSFVYCMCVRRVWICEGRSEPQLAST